jgi:hypothetical protein
MSSVIQTLWSTSTFTISDPSIGCTDRNSLNNLLGSSSKANTIPSMCSIRTAQFELYNLIKYLCAEVQSEPLLLTLKVMN